MTRRKRTGAERSFISTLRRYEKERRTFGRSPGISRLRVENKRWPDRFILVSAALRNITNPLLVHRSRMRYAHGRCNQRLTTSAPSTFKNKGTSSIARIVGGEEMLLRKLSNFAALENTVREARENVITFYFRVLPRPHFRDLCKTNQF